MSKCINEDRANRMGGLVWDARASWISVTIFSAVFCLIGTWDFALRMAGMHGDDGPIFYAYAFHDPSLFEGDFPLGFPLSVLVPVKVITSAMIWIPALLWDKLNVDPYVSAWAMTFAQAFLFGIATYSFALASVEDRFVAFLSMVFAFIAGIWGWNPANYASTLENMLIPYPANLALAPILFAFTCIIRGHKGSTFVFLAIGGLIHPNVTLYACAILMVYWLLQGIHHKFCDLWRNGIGIAAVFLIAVSPAMVATMNLPIRPLPPAEIMEGMRANQHIFPWNYERRWSFTATITILWTMLGILSLRWKSNFSPKVNRLYIASLIGAIILGLSHVLGALFENAFLLNLTGLRSFLWVAFLSLPLVIYYWYMHALYSGVGGAMIGMLSLMLPLVAYEYALFWPLVLVGLVLDLSQGKLSILSFSLSERKCQTLRVIALFVLAFWSVAFLGGDVLRKILSSGTYEAITDFSWSARGNAPDSTTRLALIAGTLGTALALNFPSYTRWMFFKSLFIGQKKSVGRIFTCLFVAFYGTIAIYMNLESAEQLRESQARSALDVQIWARNKTNRSAMFVIPFNGWRTMSIRRGLSPFTRESHAYVSTAEQKEHRDRLLAFYGIPEEKARALRGGKLIREERKLFWNFEEKDFLRFASEFGATHLVLPKKSRRDKRKLILPVEYENEGYTVYRLERLTG